MKKTFPGGIHPPYFKEATKASNIKKASLPEQVAIPLCQHIGVVCKAPLVSIGDEVKVGTLIAKSDKFISAYTHSSISGKVKKIEKRPHPTLGVCDSIVIDSDGSDKYAFDGQKTDVSTLTAQDIIATVREAGIVGMGGACFPTHVKLSPPKDKLIDTFILNGAECEPYLSCDHRLMLESAQGIIKGTLLIMKAIGVDKGIIAIEDNKLDAIEVMQEAIKKLHATDPKLQIAKYRLEVVSLHTKYPQGGEKQLIKALLNREVPPGALPFDVGCLVDNVATAHAIYEAVYYKKPLYERVVTVCGDAINNPSNLLVRIGTPVASLIEECGGLKDELGKIISGGPMMGQCQYTQDIPVIKGTSGILLLSKKQSNITAQAHCIRCGNCVDACPVNLMPTTIALAAEKRRLDVAADFYASDCIECGACAYVCPSKISLVHLIKQAKKDLICQVTI